MSDECDSQIIEFPEISYEERLQLAHQRWKESNGDIPISRAANMYEVKKSTFRDRINGAILKTEAS